MITPNLTFNFTAATLDSRVAISRALNTATRVNSSGLIEVVNASLPRFDYDPITLAAKGLLIEEQRTNLLTYSEQFDNAAWTKLNATVTSNALVAPDGTLSADKVIANTSLNPHAVRKPFAFSASTTYTLGCFAKAGERNQLYLAFGGNTLGLPSFDYRRAAFDLSLGTVIYSPLGSGAASIVNVGNGWYRCSLTVTTGTQDLTANNEIGIWDQTTNVYTGDDTSGIYIWGAQFEAGAFPTSYIPTTTAAVTRNADVATITGTAFSGFWRAGPGSILVRALPSTVSGTRPLVQVDDATADNIIALRGNTTNPELYIRAGGSDQATIDAGTISAAAYRLAGAWQAGSAAASLNSGLAVNGAPASIPAVTQMRLGSDGTNYLNGHLQAVEYYDERVSDAGLRMLASAAGRRSMLRPIINRII